MKSIVKYVFLSLLCFNSVHAALPPFFQSVSEIRTLLGENELSNYIHAGEAIVEIKRNDKGYEILTREHRLQVDVNYKPATMPGPAEFDFHFHEPVNRVLDNQN